MVAREQVLAEGELLGTGEAVGDVLGELEGDADGEVEGAGVGVDVPMITVPPGTGEGRVPTGGFGLVPGTSTCSSFLQEAARRRTTIMVARAKDRLGRRIIGLVSLAFANAQSVNQHGVAVAVKAIPLCDGPFVSIEDVLPPGECAGEEEEGRLRQVEIRDQSVDRLKSVSWADNEVGFPWSGFQSAARDHALQSANGCGAHRYDSLTPLARAGIGLCDLLGNIETLGQDSMIRDVLGMHTRESTRSDVEHDFANDDPHLSEAIEQAVGEVKAGGRSGDAPWFLRVHRLVSLPIERTCRAVDVGGQRQVAEPLKQVQDADVAALEAHRAFAISVNCDHSTGGAVFKGDPGSHAELPARSHKGPKLIGVRRFRKKVEDLGSTPSAGATQEAGRKHTAPVEDEEVAGTEIARQVGEAGVLG
jgi:hypothetical protein